MIGTPRIVSVVLPVFRDGARALQAARSLLPQHLPPDTLLEVVLVDDGSGDGTPELLGTLKDSRVHVLALGLNQGRSAARNAGAHFAGGDMVVFMDCDCLPLHDRFLSLHMEALDSGHIASTGHVVGTGGGFWDRYQREASSRRAIQHARGMPWSGSSQNMAVRKPAFEQVGGFDTGYRHYGFEDRDLLLRLSALGSIAWSAGSGVSHLDKLALRDVSRKMTEAGTFTSRRFATRHPQAYRGLGYAALDARDHWWLRPLGALLGPRLPAIAGRMDAVLLADRVPYPLRKALVRVVSALSFVYGTMRSSD